MSCCLCDCVETVNHLFFKCHLAKLVWSMLQNIFELDFGPRSLEDLSIIWLQGKGPLRIGWSCFSLQDLHGPCGPREIKWQLKNRLLKHPLM